MRSYQRKVWSAFCYEMVHVAKKWVFVLGMHLGFLDVEEFFNHTGGKVLVREV